MAFHESQINKQNQEHMVYKDPVSPGNGLSANWYISDVFFYIIAFSLIGNLFYMWKKPLHRVVTFDFNYIHYWQKIRKLM